MEWKSPERLPPREPDDHRSSSDIDNAAAGQAIRPLCVGRRNWLHLGGDGGLTPSAVLLSITASVKRQHLDPWAYLRHVLTALPARTAAADLAGLLPDKWVRCGA